MKEIKAFVSRQRIADVIQAVKQSESFNQSKKQSWSNLSVFTVKGVERMVDTQDQHYSLDLAETVIDESMMELICEDDHVEELVQAIKLAGTGSKGWILVTDIIQATPIV